jgi:hypothetical protein
MTPPPPRLPGCLLECVLPGRECDYVMGDLIEEYALRAQRSAAMPVRCWYTMQVCRSIVPLLWMSTARAGWLGTLGIAGAAWMAASIVEALGVMLLQLVLAPESFVFTLGSMAIGLATIAGGGYLAGRIRQPSPMVMAVIVLLVVVVLMATASETAPSWYAVVFLVGGPVAAVGGGIIASGAVRRSVRS